MKYQSVKDFFHKTNSETQFDKEIEKIVNETIEKSLTKIKKKANRFKSFLQNNYEFCLPNFIYPKVFVRKMMNDQKLREIRKNNRMENSLQRLQKKTEEIEEEIRIKEEKKKIKYQAQVKEMAENAEIRKNNLSQKNKSEIRGIKKEKRLYKILDEAFQRKVISSEIKQRENFLRERKNSYLPIRLSQIMDHAKKHSKILENLSQSNLHKRSKTAEGVYKIRKSAWLEKILRREKDEKEEAAAKALEKKNSVEKKQIYSNLVLAVYPPKIDLMKKKELETIKERILFPVRRKTYSRNSITRSKSVFISSKSTKSKLVTGESDIRSVAKVDYLKEMRDNRKLLLREIQSKSVESRNFTSREKTKKNPENSAKISTAHQISLRNFSYSNFENLIKAEQEANDFLIQSVKSKLFLLNNSISSL